MGHPRPSRPEDCRSLALLGMTRIGFCLRGGETEILRWQTFALRRPALPQDDGGLRMWLTSDTHISKITRCGAPGFSDTEDCRSLALLGMTRIGFCLPSGNAEILRWQAFALRRPALPQDDGGLRGWLTSDTHISKSARCGAPGFSDTEDCRSLALLGMTTAGILMGRGVQRSFVGRPSRCDGLRFLRMTAGWEGDVADFAAPTSRRPRDVGHPGFLILRTADPSLCSG
jgi:hypothetical protein